MPVISAEFRHFPFRLTLLGAALLWGSSTPAHALQRLGLNAGVSFPHIIEGELDLLYTPKWSIGFNVGGFAYTYQNNGTPIPLSIEAANFRVRYHPFSGSFFVGIAAGMQKLGASASQTISVTDPSSSQSVAVPAVGALSVLSPYVTPHLGWMIVTRWHVTVMFEAGYQFPTHSSSTLDASISDATLEQYLSLVQQTASYQKLQTDIQNKVDQIGNLALPYVALRLGWTF